jgi:tRNA threonylcarbamoyladenosine dehydratase
MIALCCSHASDFIGMTAFDFHSHKTQLIATAVAASLATATVLSVYTSYSRRERRKNLNEEIFRSIALSEETKSNVPTPPSGDVVRDGDDLKYDEDLIKEQLARNYAFFSEEGMSKIRGGTVVVVGCGGVGSWAAVMLVRS